MSVSLGWQWAGSGSLLRAPLQHREKAKASRKVPVEISSLVSKVTLPSNLSQLPAVSEVIVLRLGRPPMIANIFSFNSFIEV